MKNCLVLLFLYFSTYSISQGITYPLNLMTPFDEDTIETILPNFIWMTDLTALANDPRLSQHFVLVEKESNQTKSEAIATNIPLVVLNNVTTDNFSYSFSNTELQRGHTYAWQVKLYYNELLIQSSDPWQFTIKADQPFYRQYITLKSEPDASYFSTTEDTLYFKVKANYDFDNQKVEVIHEDGTIFQASFEQVIIGDEPTSDVNTINEGIENYLSLNIGSLNLSQGIHYLKVAIGDKTFYQKFDIE